MQRQVLIGVSGMVAIALIGSAAWMGLDSRPQAVETVPALKTAASAPAERQVPESQTEIQLSFAPVVKQVTPAVVNVYATKTEQGFESPFANDPFFSRFFGRDMFRSRPQTSQSLGSGVIVDPKGVIVTNSHVVSGADDIRIALSGGREYPVTLLLDDPKSDLAVLQIDNPNGRTFPALTYAESDDLEVGDLVLAVGNPFGVGQTVTSGIVSALARTQGGASDYSSFIQTDAAINPGNSGGPLVTMDGRLVGINSSIVSASGGNIGIGFAIPANMARLVVEGALGGGIRRPWFGAQGQAVSADVARSMGMARPQGVLLSQVYPGGPAAAAGIVRGDVVLSVDGFEINDPQTLNYRVATHRAGDTARVHYTRSGVAHDAVVRVNLPPDTGRDEMVLTGRQPMQGVRVSNITPALAEEMQLDAFAGGVVIRDVDARSPAAQLGFRAGDVVREVNGQQIDSVTTLNRVMNGAQNWDIAVQRGDQILSLSI